MTRLVGYVFLSSTDSNDEYMSQDEMERIEDDCLQGELFEPC